MNLVALTEQLRELLEYDLQKYSVTQPLPKLKRPTSGQHGYDPSGASAVGTKASRPSSLDKGGGDGTRAGVKHPDVPDSGTHTKTHAKPKGRDTKTQATPGTKAKTGGGDKPTSCPGGGQPRMVFGKWRCASGGGSKGSQQAKSRIAAKRKKKAAPKPKVGGLAKLVNKARAALKGLFK